MRHQQKKIVFNLLLPPFEEAADDDCNIEEDLDYEFDTYLDDITINPDRLSLISKESAIDSIYHHRKARTVLTKKLLLRKKVTTKSRSGIFPA
jgi:hypothetical protein